MTAFIAKLSTDLTDNDITYSIYDNLTACATAQSRTQAERKGI